ncbi:uncharacterized protein YuzE [Aureimonas pseudogalii]|uniref:Uncharacterized protein YuzE n=1 Tax=Aureimonas pseudogalii TaxID=1744844 RepID=A0A7W6H498_9HYPH|nr:uncharacterized protein YuzE [Aureimonas pseudogalii]
MIDVTYDPDADAVYFRIGQGRILAPSPYKMPAFQSVVSRCGGVTSAECCKASN